jgi:hypothetical protein
VARRFVQVRTRVARACRAEPHARRADHGKVYRSNQKFEHAAQQIVFQEEIDSIEDAVQRLRRLEKQLALSPGGTLDRRYNPTEGPHLAGNRRARRALIEAAWTYRYPARVTETLRARLEALPKPVRNIAWKAQIRLCARYRRLSAKGKKLPVVVAAIAREIAALLWAIGREALQRKPGRPVLLSAAQSREWSTKGGELPSLVMWPGCRPSPVL